LRRKDLRWIYLPTIFPSPLPDGDTERWIMTFLPRVYPAGVRKVRHGSDLSSGTARHLLEQTLPASAEDFYESEVDLKLACAARAIEKYRYFEARSSLETLLPRLPPLSVAAPYLFDALRSVGGASTPAVLAEVVGRFERDRWHHVQALCACATPGQQGLLERLRGDSDWFVAREAGRALERLQVQNSSAEEFKVRS
jgi:hypothetical protein